MANKPNWPIQLDKFDRAGLDRYTLSLWAPLFTWSMSWSQFLAIFAYFRRKNGVFRNLMLWSNSGKNYQFLNRIQVENFASCKLVRDKFMYFKFGTCKVLNLNSIWEPPSVFVTKKPILLAIFFHNIGPPEFGPSKLDFLNAFFSVRNERLWDAAIVFWLQC
jgi:hypothetical protein